MKEQTEPCEVCGKPSYGQIYEWNIKMFRLIEPFQLGPYVRPNNTEIVTEEEDDGREVLCKRHFTKRVKELESEEI